MNADLKAAVKINSLAGKVRPFDLMMDLITRYGHWAFVIYGLLLWFTPGKTREDRRNACVSAFIGVCIASLISYAIGRVWKRERPFRESPQIWNFTGHRANASFPSNHTMNGCVVAMELLRHNTKGSKLMAVLAGILAFPACLQACIIRPTCSAGLRCGHRPQSCPYAGCFRSDRGAGSFRLVAV